MATSLVKKLRIQPGQRIAIINPQAGYIESLVPLPEDVTVLEEVEDGFDLVQIFAANSDDLARYGPAAIAAVKKDGLLWISYPKKSSGMETDLTRDEGWQVITGAGLRGVFQISIDDTWSAVRFRPVEHAEPEDKIDAQYAGKKTALRPIYDRVLQIVMELGDDIAIQPRNTYVAFEGRLEDGARIGSGSITHKVALASPDDLDDEVVGWLRDAYEGV